MSKFLHDAANDDTADDDARAMPILYVFFENSRPKSYSPH